MSTRIALAARIPRPAAPPAIPDDPRTAWPDPPACAILERMDGWISAAAGRIYAQLATALFALTGVLQFVLAPGAVTAAIAVLLTGCAWIVRWRAGVLRNRPPTRTAGILATLVIVFVTINLLFNVGSGSTLDRALLGTLWLLLALCCLLVAAAAVERTRK